MMRLAFSVAIFLLLATGTVLEPPAAEDVRSVMVQHLAELHRFYGERQGVRIARKHLGWYLRDRPGGETLRARLVRVDSAAQQLDLLNGYFQDWQALAA